jgi:SAM-dependent methyltransferase
LNLSRAARTKPDSPITPTPRLRMPKTDTISANLYDFPKYYELIFGSDWKAEFDFLRDCFAKHADRDVKRVFEPACGTGRLLVKLAQAGYEVSGNDLNEKAVNYCNDRLARHGLPRSVFVGDMADFRLKKKADAAFNMINSFRHLPTEEAAVAHFRCVAESLGRGGLYLLGMHLTPTDDDWEGEENWHARRGNLSVISELRTVGFDRKKRMEKLHMSFDVRTPTRHFTLVDEMHYRTYTRFQMKALFKKIPAFEVAETYDFCYDVDDPITVDETTEDVVYVLRKR